MNPIEQATAAFQRIFPAGADCPHDYAREGFRALAEAQAERIRFQDEIARLRQELADANEGLLVAHSVGYHKRDAEVSRLAGEVEKLKQSIGTVHAAWNVESGDFCVTTMVDTVEAAHRIAAACGKAAP